MKLFGAVIGGKYDQILMKGEQRGIGDSGYRQKFCYRRGRKKTRIESAQVEIVLVQKFGFE